MSPDPTVQTTTAAPQPDPRRVAHWLSRAAAAALDEGATRRLLGELVTEYSVAAGEPALPAAPLQSTPVLT